MKACAGDWVEVRSKEEILGTLDNNGRLDELPFMPQMFKHCGQRFRICKSAYKTCDTVSGHYAGRRLQDGVHLNLRCDGQAYGGCQAGCLIFWKNAWLKPVDGPVQVQHVPKRVPFAERGSGFIATLHGERRLARHKAPRRRRRCQIFLSGDRIAQLHEAAQVVGCPAVCGFLYVRQQNTARASPRLFVFVLLLWDAGLQRPMGAPSPLAVQSRSRPSPAAFRSPD